MLLRAAGPGLVVCAPCRPGSAARPLGSSSRSPARPCRPRARLAVWGSLPPGPAKPVGSVDLHSGRSACELVAGVVHPIRRHCTLSDRVQCPLTGGLSTCPGRGRIVYGASSWFPNNVACNFPVNLLCIEIVSLQFQRFWVMGKVRSTELHATFGRAAQRLPLNRTCPGLVRGGSAAPRPRPWGIRRAPASSVGEPPRPRPARRPRLCLVSQLRMPLALGR